jgi:hypothetical protein
MQRDIARQLQNPGVGTKAQQALKALQEQNKTDRKKQSKLRKDEENERQFEIRQQKKKEKHIRAGSALMLMCLMRMLTSFKKKL